MTEQLVKQPPLTVRYARVAIVQQPKRMILDNLGYGLAIEGLGAIDLASAQKRTVRRLSLKTVTGRWVTCVVIQLAATSALRSCETFA